LALLAPERVHEIIKPEKWQKIEPESWIAQAKARVNQDPLEDIVGIGDLYARRLNEAGVYSFAQLVALTPERVREVVKAEGSIDAESWIEQARGFASKKAQTRAAFGTRSRGFAPPKDLSGY
jgi:predicted flap endonuclease-1-like 5' DNA nuclease